MVKEGYWFGLPPFAAGGVLLALGISSGSEGGVKPPLHLLLPGAVLIFLALFVFYFFRNPDRKIPMEPGVVVSPADGRVVVVKDEENAGRPGKRISIFLAIWNVHVNRSPAAGTIAKLEYKPGKFLAAWAEKASLENEQNVFTLSSEYGEIVFKQIAGWVARRVVSWKKVGDTVGRGELVGLVRFGSRVDVWLPEGAEVAVKVGDNVKGGSSVVARMPAGAGVSATRGGESSGAQKIKESGHGA
ncbi:MAG TPA: phosphatidylserine decarboxylase family protein [Candidatus Acidoferrales bacterium]|nr:phosphatidylserine decarboxylase family protein [Candidatus Acidoferrales bacterium]